MTKQKMRTEKDSIWSVKVPFDASWGVYTQRVLQTYPNSCVPKLPEEFLRTYIESKIIYSTVNGRFRKISQDQKRAISMAWKNVLKKSSEEFMNHFPISQIQSWWWTSTNMMINEVLANEATVVLWWKYGKYLVDSHDHLNASQSSNDTFPGVTKLTILKLLPNLLDEISLLEKTCKKLASRWRTIKKVGRTHLQDAVTITVWDEFWAYARSLEKNKKYILHASKALFELNFWWSATWSLQNITPAMRKEIIREFSTFYWMSFIQPKSFFEQNSSSWDLSYFSQSLAHLSNDLIKIWNDLRLLSSWPLAWFHEIDFPLVHEWSSIMPGKVNPSVIEALTMVCARVIGNDQTIQLLSRQAQLQLQQFMPGIARPLIENIQRLTKSISMFTNNCVAWITINKKRIQQSLDGSFVAATDFTELLGYEVVAQAVQEALVSWKSLHDLLASKIKKVSKKK